MGKKHNVHIYAVVRVKVCGIEADTHEEAMAKADEIALDKLDELFPEVNCTNAAPEEFDTIEIQNAGYSEEIVGHLVDEEHDPEFLNSVSYDARPKITEDNEEESHGMSPGM